MKKQNGAKPGLPPGARAEVLEVLFTNMEISGDEISAILKKHHVSYDADALQDRYRRQVGQRLMASLPGCLRGTGGPVQWQGQVCRAGVLQKPPATGSYPPENSKPGAWPECLRRQGKIPHCRIGPPDRPSQKGGVR